MKGGRALQRNCLDRPINQQMIPEVYSAVKIQRIFKMHFSGHSIMPTVLRIWDKWQITLSETIPYINSLLILYICLIITLSIISFPTWLYLFIKWYPLYSSFIYYLSHLFIALEHPTSTLLCYSMTYSSALYNMLGFISVCCPRC